MARERKNVNLPGVVVDLPTLTAKDEEDLVKWGVPNDIDFIAASFVRKGSDLDYIRKVHMAALFTRSLSHLLFISAANIVHERHAY
jgi:pyruvate kinase